MIVVIRGGSTEIFARSASNVLSVVIDLAVGSIRWLLVFGWVEIQRILPS